MSNITTEMVEEFNRNMENRNSIIRLYKSGSYAVDIKLILDSFLKMEEQVINPTKEFYDYLQQFFKQKGVTIRFNNTWSCFWAVETSILETK